MKKLLAVVLILALAAAAAAGAAAWLVTAKPPRAEPVTVLIEPGTGARGAAERLARAGVIADSSRFLLALRLRKGMGRIKSGEYEFAGPVSPLEAAEILMAGRVKSYRIPLPPGGTVAHLLARAQEASLLPPLDAAAVSELADRYEGRLKPDTYVFSKPISPEEMLGRMAAAYEPFWTRERTDRLAALGMSRREAEIRASIIEKETGRAEERPLVSAVIRNRLKRGMPLQMDPTNIYGLTRAGLYKGNFGRVEVQIDTPWSSYHHGGLPPTAIGSPSPESLDAALNPAASDALYFVTDGTGGHRFSATYGDHLRNVEHSKEAAPTRR